MTKRVNVLGTGISVLNLWTALDAIAEAVRMRRKGYVCVTGVHGVMESQRDEALRRVHNDAGLVTPDGMRLAFGLSRIYLRLLQSTFSAEYGRFGARARRIHRCSLEHSSGLGHAKSATRTQPEWS